MPQKRDREYELQNLTMLVEYQIHQLNFIGMQLLCSYLKS